MATPVNSRIEDRAAPMMERLLRDAGIETGMRVLDVGCGRGEVSFMLARLVGPEGLVVGFDRDAGAMTSALARARDEGIRQVAFVTADLLTPPRDRAPFDAIVGRRVLMYQRDRLAAVRALVDVLRPGGLVVFQEVDATMLPAPAGRHPLHERVTRWIWETVAREGATTSMGFELPGVLAAAGLSIQAVRAEAIVQTAEHRHITATIVRAILPRIVEQGAATEAEIDIDTLDARLQAELLDSNEAFVGDMVFGAWATSSSSSAPCTAG
jgi:SAM-dependent methyltransferase